MEMVGPNSTEQRWGKIIKYTTKIRTQRNSPTIAVSSLSAQDGLRNTRISRGGVKHFTVVPSRLKERT